jgi:hypothetical protein
MSLERTATDVVREGHGFSFSMRFGDSRRTVRIIVCEDTLDGDDLASNDDDPLTRFLSEREALEPLDCEKCAHRRMAADGAMIITAAYSKPNFMAWCEFAARRSPSC